MVEPSAAASTAIPVSAHDLTDRIRTIVFAADLSAVSVNSVCAALEADLQQDLSSRKAEIKALVMAALQDRSKADSDAQAAAAREQEAGQHSAGAPPTEDADLDAQEARDLELARALSVTARPRRSTSTAAVAKQIAKKKKAKKLVDPLKPPRPNAFNVPCLLSPALADLLSLSPAALASDSSPSTTASTTYNISTGEHLLSRPQVVSKIWEYIKAHNLQDPKNKRFILCDAKMQAVFKTKRLNFLAMNRILTQHCKRPQDCSQ